MKHRTYQLQILLFLSYPKNWTENPFRLLLEEMSPKTSKDPSPSKPLSGIEVSMESHTIELQLLLQSKHLKYHQIYSEQIRFR